MCISTIRDACCAADLTMQVYTHTDESIRRFIGFGTNPFSQHTVLGMCNCCLPLKIEARSRRWTGDTKSKDDPAEHELLYLRAAGLFLSLGILVAAVTL